MPPLQFPSLQQQLNISTAYRYSHCLIRYFLSSTSCCLKCFCYVLCHTTTRYLFFLVLLKYIIDLILCQFLLYSTMTYLNTHTYTCTHTHTHTYIYIFFSIMVYPSILNIVSCAIQCKLIVYPYYIL